MPQIGYYPPPQGPGAVGGGLMGLGQGLMQVAQMAQQQKQFDAKIAIAKEQAAASQVYREEMLHLRGQAGARQQAGLELDLLQAQKEQSKEDAALQADLHTMGAMREALYAGGVGEPGKDFTDVLGDDAIKAAQLLDPKIRREWLDQLYPQALAIKEQYQTEEFQRRAEQVRGLPGVTEGAVEGVAVGLAGKEIQSEEAFAALEKITVEGAARDDFDKKYMGLAEGIAGLQVDPDVLDSSFDNDAVAKMLGYLSSDLSAAKTQADLGAIYARLKKYKTLASSDTQEFIDQVGRDLGKRQAPSQAAGAPGVGTIGHEATDRGGLPIKGWFEKAFTDPAKAWQGIKQFKEAQQTLKNLPERNGGDEVAYLKAANKALEGYGFANLNIDEMMFILGLDPEEAFVPTANEEGTPDYWMTDEFRSQIGINGN